MSSMKRKKKPYRAGPLCDQRKKKKKKLRGLVVFVINEKKKNLSG